MPGRWEYSAGSSGPSVPPLQRASLVLGKPAPHTRILSGVECPTKAGLDDVAASADGLGLLDLEDCRAGVPDREEELGVLVEAGCRVAPVHGLVPLLMPGKGGCHCLVTVGRYRDRLIRDARVTGCRRS